ncbi:MAG TPA: sulfatase-like hydrolase/transferase [Candidatus Binatia bacterium]|nr:sulfatase-like hydrolase/transferase [Candidatus Binatia bacterium]
MPKSKLWFSGERLDLIAPIDQAGRVATRFHSKRTILALLVLIGVLVVTSLAAEGASKPNFILILADDMGYGDIGPFGSTKNRTPNLDRMAQEGLRFTSFYAAPVCTPSRAQILTGCYAKRVSLPNVLSPAAAIGLSTNEHTIAELLKAQGYATMAVGKWHVGDAPEFLPTRHGFDSYFGLPYSNDMGGPANLAKGRRQRRPPLPLVQNEQVIETVTPEGQNRLTERYTEAALKFVREHKDAPFFLYLPHTAVHVPIHPGDRFRGKSPNGLYSDWVEEVDWSVGRVLDTVRELGLAERTLVIFTSDNGPWLSQGTNAGVAGPLRGGKGGTYEGGVREPTIAWWPSKVPHGGAVDAIAANFDFLPTFVSLAGGTLPPDDKIDGLDISPLLLGRTKESPHQAHYYFSGNALQAVRSGPWKLAVARQSEGLGKTAAAPDTAKPFTPTLYNLDEDIGEKRDVAGQHPEVVKRLQGLVAQMGADLGLTATGPGVRPPGRVAHAVGLWLPGQAPAADVLAAHYDLQSLDKLEIGDVLDQAEAPQIAGKALTISAEVSPEAPDGVIIAQGGSFNGYAVHLRGGKPAFTVREAGDLVSISAAKTPAAHFRLEARLARDGAMMLAIDGKTVARGKAPGLIPGQPHEDFCVGHDNGRPVGDYDGRTHFRGAISKLKVVAE